LSVCLSVRTNPVPQVIYVGSSQLEVIREFTYLGACTTHDGSMQRRPIGIARNCVTLLEKHIRKSHIRVETKVRLYGVYVFPVLLYGFEVWSVTKDAFDTWSLPKILRIPYTKHVTNFTVRQILPAVLQFPTVSERDGSASSGMWVARVDPEQDHHRVTGSSLRPPSHWRRPCGRPRTSWLRAIDTDVAYSQSTSGSTQPGERPVTARSGDVSSTRQDSIMGHAATEERKMHITGTARPNFAPNFVHAIFFWWRCNTLYFRFCG